MTWKVQCDDLTRRVRDEIAAIAGEAQARVVEVRAKSEFSDSAKKHYRGRDAGSVEDGATGAGEDGVEARGSEARPAAVVGWRHRRRKTTGPVTAEELIVDACRRDW